GPAAAAAEAAGSASAAGAAPTRITAAAGADPTAAASTAGEAAEAVEAGREAVALELGGQRLDFVPVEGAVLIRVALGDQVLHPLGQFVLGDLAVLVLVARQDPLDDLVH